MKGRWYRAASGRLILAYNNSRVDNIVFNKIFRDMKKFKKRAINDTKIIPCNDIFSISFVCN
mgnify:CR=1 FL=1